MKNVKIHWRNLLFLFSLVALIIGVVIHNKNCELKSFDSALNAYLDIEEEEKIRREKRDEIQRMKREIARIDQYLANEKLLKIKEEAEKHQKLFDKILRK